MKKTAKTLAFFSIAFLALVLACPAPADDFKFGLGGGATFLTGDYADTYKTGWTATLRALWLPTFIGLRAAGYYGQNAPKTPEILGTMIKDSSLYGGDLNAVLRLIGGGANGFYLNGGIGVRALRQEFQTPAVTTTQTNTNISYNGGLGISAGWFFVEANAVYFKVNDANLWSFPLTAGFQF